MSESYRIQSGRLGHKYAVLTTFDNKEDQEPIVNIIKAGFEYLEKTRKRIQRAKELEEEERKRIDVNSDGELFL